MPNTQKKPGSPDAKTTGLDQAEEVVHASYSIPSFTPLFIHTTLSFNSISYSIVPVVEQPHPFNYCNINPVVDTDLCYHMTELQCYIKLIIEVKLFIN